MFGLAFYPVEPYNYGMVIMITIQVRIHQYSLSKYSRYTNIVPLMQILYLCVALFVLACFFTFVALLRPRGHQPATYGHLQTLANLVDEWSPVMWWGHKEDGIPYCHAGIALESSQ
jgi:hypothetical protein